MKRKGISLIVLIITIIVIVILAAAIILSVAKNKSVVNANEAVNQSDLKTAQEAVLMWISDRWVQDTNGNGIEGEEAGSYYTGTITKDPSEVTITKDGKTSKVNLTVADLGLDSLDKVVIENNVVKKIEKGGTAVSNGTNTPETPVVAVGTIVEDSNATVTGEEFAYNNPVIPVGFKAKETTKASWQDTDSDGIVDGWNNGLVIADENENEFVWVPVDGTDVTYSKWNGSKSTNATVTKEQVEDDTLPSGISAETAQIIKYEGFYVARYEAGLPDEQTTEELMATKAFSAGDNNKTNIGKAQSKADKIVWTRIDYNNAKIVSEAVISTEYVQSGLVTGTQWDTMLTFLAQEVDVDTDCTAWGNYYNKYGYTINGYYRTQYADVVYSKGEYTKSANGYLLLQTGKFGSVVYEGSPKNLFDVTGNVWEWTSETVIEKGGTSTAVGNKLIRGGSYADYRRWRRCCLISKWCM